MSSPLTSGRAPAISGSTPAAEPIGLELSGKDADLLFLTSDCRECRSRWARVRSGDVIVTPDPSTESARSVAKLAPPGAMVIMSSRGWHDYGITKAPWLVEVRDGVVRSSRPAL
ncbi:MAG TPA: hypothetical protein VFJ79_03655 [Acidimicrobiales bacterium]|nr:hypothetical protein [Acidimicrobiales bacterium]